MCAYCGTDGHFVFFDRSNIFSRESEQFGSPGVVKRVIAQIKLTDVLGGRKNMSYASRQHIGRGREWMI